MRVDDRLLTVTSEELQEPVGVGSLTTPVLQRQGFCNKIMIWGSACDFQQCGILTCVDSDDPLQPPFKLRNSKWCSVSSLTIIEYSSDKQRLWSDCTYAQADLRLCWSHIPHCWKSHTLAHISAYSTFITRISKIYGPRREKTCLGGYWPGHTQNSLLSYKD